MTDTSNAGFGRAFREDELTFGAIFPLEGYEGTTASMEDQVERAQLAEELGFDALWFRDVPLLDPSFGDAGQVYDPWVYLSHIAAHTEDIALATGAIVLPLRHPLHVAKAAASVDQLSDGRLVLGVASGDRPVEFDAFGVDRDSRGERFREHFRVLDTVLEEEFPEVASEFGEMNGDVDLIPKPTAGGLPMPVTGHARQEEEWLAEHADAWMYYTQDTETQADVVDRWRDLTDEHAPGEFKPFGQATYVDLAADPTTPPSEIHQGFRTGRDWLVDYVETLADIGVDHLLFNLKYSERPVDEVLRELGNEVIPNFR